MRRNEKELTEASNSNICPVHHAGPKVNINNDHITIRCCCDFFTRNYISRIRNKFKGKTMKDLLDTWETDLLMNELHTR